VGHSIVERAVKYTVKLEDQKNILALFLRKVKLVVWDLENYL
jgi:hypothetical protein